MSNRKPQRTVREGQLNRTLEAFNQEMAFKVASSMGRFHEQYVADLERRLAICEFMLGIRLYRWTATQVLRVKQWVVDTFTEPVVEEEGGEESA